MNRIVLVLIAVMSLYAFGGDENPRKVLPYPPSMMAEYNAKTGGLVEPPKDAKKLCLVDARTEGRTSLTNFEKAIERQLNVDWIFRDMSGNAPINPLKVARDAKAAGAGAVVVLFEDKDAPVLTAYPEEAIAALNTKPLADKETVVYRRRFSKEFWRAISFALGGYTVQSQNSVMQPVFSLKDLDNLNSFSLSPFQVSAIATAKAKLNVFGSRPVPYSRACREGWAPAPTNDVQRKFFKAYGDPTSRFRQDFASPKVDYK